PENLSRQLRLAQAAEKFHKNALAARAYLRAGQLAVSANKQEDALNLLGRAHALAPGERSVALLYGEARLRAGDAAEAAKLMAPFAASESDAAFLETYSDALIRSGQLDQAQTVLERLLREKNAGVPRMFELADAYATSGRDQKAVEIFLTL